MTALLYLLGVVIFVAAILVSIGLHELGHMIPAKKFGGKVTQYFIGFGPTVWSKQVGETEYGVKAVPLGGYVKIVGMLPPAAEELVDSVEHDADGNPVHRVRKSNTGMFTQLISDARSAEWELIRPEDDDRLFYKMAWWKKVVVMAGGPTVNLLIAFVLFLIVFSTYGQRTQEVEPGAPVVATVSQCAIAQTGDGPPRQCTADDPISPALDAGLVPGDRIVGFNGVEVTGWQQLRDLIEANAQGTASITYVRDGEETTAETNTTVKPPSPGDDPEETVREVGFLGISPTTYVAVEKGGPIYTLDAMGTMTVDTVKALGQLPMKVFDVGQAILGLEERAPDSPVSIVGGGRFAGEQTSSEVLDVQEKTIFLLTLIAGFNLFIGLFNFLPLLPLDGGHIASALWEAVRRGIARLRRKPDPGYVDAAKLLPVAYVVASAMLVMGVVLIVGDIVVPLDISG
ncbi:site-2 protease family protein [Nocardioides sp. 1609]|uniref:M50 family metallopeptidase n=1 Tax=Nocardioides sp. 1609 TaxID=2508327 RepID=UPI00106FF0D7|nr:site-2 protease family protein [Nocardioides sp. 1609]